MGDLDEVGRQLVWSSSKHSPGEEWWKGENRSQSDSGGKIG